MEFVSVSKAADLVGMTKENVYRMIRETPPQFPFVKEVVDGRARFKIPLADLARWMQCDIEKKEAALNVLKRGFKKVNAYLM